MRYLMTFSYDGSKYSGYQKQKNHMTIQQNIEDILTKINNSEVKIYASGRTDAGVHALNQKAHFNLDKDINRDKLRNSLNKMINKDIYIKSIEVVDDNFHARFCVVHKEYIYKINVGEYNPLEMNYIYQYNKELNISNMKKACRYLVGTHDFKSFTKTGDQKDNYVKTIYKIKIVKRKDNIIISFKGNGFLRYMIRNIVGLLIEIGNGQRNPIDAYTVLIEKNRTKSGITASPVGLYLNEVKY